MVIAVKAGLEKLEIYYEKTDDTTMYTIATVLDPQFKLGYCEDNKWRQSFIRYSKETIIFWQKENLQQNEVELYLKTPRADRNQDVLLWWKGIAPSNNGKGLYRNYR
ncbi:hypothetical protein GLOIN_2v1430460 [Rhizophagus irregularis DAOM 181602=DAOM 197198]|uniref:Uncharacterized protein n=1 Tax=Rhizophagus irregularis (strain DAOM 181602 / DAOM 197198 / MUCL 43194) TaxID=747089 RepID=U9UDV6_RHIID|nr:hypothetical protein GLOIN_2v1430460 [Rhizophagus irregularis DAOM 181602=DAOM 197198]